MKKILIAMFVVMVLSFSLVLATVCTTDSDCTSSKKCGSDGECYACVSQGAMTGGVFNDITGEFPDLEGDYVSVADECMDGLLYMGDCQVGGALQYKVIDCDDPADNYDANFNHYYCNAFDRACKLSVGQSCVGPADACGHGYACVSGYCRQECSSDSDCEVVDGFTCESSYCQPPECDHDNDCVYGEECVDFVCQEVQEESSFALKNAAQAIPVGDSDSDDSKAALRQRIAQKTSDSGEETISCYYGDEAVPIYIPIYVACQYDEDGRSFCSRSDDSAEPEKKGFGGFLSGLKSRITGRFFFGY